MKIIIFYHHHCIGNNGGTRACLIRLHDRVSEWWFNATSATKAIFTARDYMIDVSDIEFKGPIYILIADGGTFGTFSAHLQL